MKCYTDVPENLGGYRSSVTMCSIWARYKERLPTSTRLGRPASTGVHRGTSRTGRRGVGGTRRRPGVTAQISATPVQDLSPFPEPGQSALASHRPSRCEGGTASELRFSTFLSRVYSRQLSVYSPFALSRTMFSRHHALSPHLREPVLSFFSAFFFFSFLSFFSLQTLCIRVATPMDYPWRRPRTSRRHYNLHGTIIQMLSTSNFLWGLHVISLDLFSILTKCNWELVLVKFLPFERNFILASQEMVM